MLRPRVVGEWVGREEEDADPLAAEMLHPPVPRVKTEVCWSGDNGPAGRLVISISKLQCACVTHLMEIKKVQNFKNVHNAIVGALKLGVLTVLPEECPSEWG